MPKLLLPALTTMLLASSAIAHPHNEPRPHIGFCGSADIFNQRETYDPRFNDRLFYAPDSRQYGRWNAPLQTRDHSTECPNGQCGLPARPRLEFDDYDFSPREDRRYDDFRGYSPTPASPYRELVPPQPRFDRVAPTAARPPVRIRWQTDLRKAVAYADRMERPMLLSISAPWCHHCRQMQTETWRSPSIVQHVNACFIPVSIDADENETLIEQLRVRSLPATLIVTPERRIVQRIGGYQSPRELERHIARHCVGQHQRVDRPLHPEEATTMLYSDITLTAIK